MWRGKRFTLPTPENYPLDAIEAEEDGRTLAALRMILGTEQYATFREIAKTTGDAENFSQAIMRHLAATLPDRFAFKSGPKNRVGKIFIDYLRNGRGATTIIAWSARARPGLGISVPLEWDELMKLKSSAQWTVANVHTRLDKGNAPWAGYAKAGKGISKAMRVLGFDE